MPIPTDTYWNLKRLNVVFAVSAILLTVTMLWAIVQDFNQFWRQPQRDAAVWEAALVEQKIERETTPEKEARLREMQQVIEEKQKALDAQKQQKEQLEAQIKKLSSDAADIEFFLNNLKSNVQVDETHLQDAITAKDTERVKKLQEKLAEPRKKLAEDTEKLWAAKTQLAEAREKLSALTADYDAALRAQKKLTEDEVALRKKLDSLRPPNMFAKLSNQVREAPLMQFINPVTKPQPVVLPDVLTDMVYKKVETLEFCNTCHVNITRKEYTLPNMIGYLEEQVASARNLKLVEVHSGRAADAAATVFAPGAVAMPEFWHLWAVRIAPEQVRKPAQMTRLNTLAKTVGAGKPIRVSIADKQLDSFAYVPDPAKKDDAQSAALDQVTRDQIMAEVIKAWIAFGSGKTTSSVGQIGVKISEATDEKAAATPRLLAMKYVEDLRTGMSTSTPEQTMKLLNERYRRALIAETNVARRKQGLAQLDPSPALLAHPRLDLYVDVDSKHSFEVVGCTSCHDGSGQETNFVLAAHTPKSIWVDRETGAPVLPAQLDTTKAPKAHEGGDLSSMLKAVYPEEAIVPHEVSKLHLTLGHQEVGAAHATTKPATATAATAQATTAPTAQATTKNGKVDHNIAEAPPEDAAPVPYFDPVTGKTGRAVSQMRHWIERFEPSAPRSFKLVYHEWDWPMRPMQYIQANCVRCHNDVNSIREEAPKVFEGRSLFVNQGCINCHQMDSVPPETIPAKPSDVRLIMANGQRKVGTDLRNIDAKLSASFINTWIWAPKSFRPSTKMPHFFMLENNSSDEELRRTRQEARAITEYLLRTATKHVQIDETGQPKVDQAGQLVGGPLPMNPIPVAAKGSVEAGAKVFATVGCQGCHTNLNYDTGEKRAGKPVSLAEKWIVTDLTKNGKLSAQLEEELGKAPDARTLTTRAADIFDHMSYNERQLYISENLSQDYSGEAAKYPDAQGTPKPIFQNHGPELSAIGTKLLADRDPEQARTWLYNWLIEPRHYSEYTVMPTLRLTPQQAIDLTEYLLAQKRDDEWRAELTPPDTAKLIELTSLFLRSRFSVQTAIARADDDAELTALATEALTTSNKPLAVAKAEAAKLSNDEKRMVFLGEKLIGNYGCMSCHAINGTETISSPCANLSEWGQKAISQLDFGYIDHHKLEGMKKDEHGKPLPQPIPMVNGLSAKASHLVGAEWKAEFADGKIAKPVEADWPHLGHSRVDWLRQKLKNSRIYDRGKALLEPDPKNNDPGKPYDKLKMPTFYLNDREVEAIITWVLANRTPLVTEKMIVQTVTPQAKQIARGRQLAQKYNCVGCHQIENNAPSVQQYYRADQLTTHAPPSLRGEGNKIQHSWLFNFLKNVELLRPNMFDGIRMPSFPIEDQEAIDIAAYFAAASNEESDTLNKTLGPARKYIQAQTQEALKIPQPTYANPTTMPIDQARLVLAQLERRAGALLATHQFQAAGETIAKAQELATGHKLTEQVGPSTKPVADRLTAATAALGEGRVPPQIMMPGEDWFTRPEFANAWSALREWGFANNQIAAIQLDPARNRPEELARNVSSLLYKANFVSELFDAQYPFVDDSRGRIDPAVYSEERFKKGEALFYEMACLACHVLGDPNVEGAQKNPTAPNLDLTYRRLQRRWVRHWVQEPGVIQTQTPMPPFLSGAAVFNLKGNSWPRNQKTLRPAEEVERDYGRTADEQADLLLDFVYAAGVRGYTGVQPGGATAAGATAPPVVQERAPATSVTPTTPPTATQPLVPGDATKGTAAEPPGAPSPKAPAAPVPQAPTGDAPKAAPTPAPKAAEPAPAPAPAPSAKTHAAGGAVSVSGVVTLNGNAPEVKEIDMSGVSQCAAHHPDPVEDESFVVDKKGNIKNVVVYVSSGLDNAPEPPKEPAVLDQKGCMYSPHVLPVMVGQPIVVKNSDAFLHNVNAQAQVNPAFNFGQPNVDPGKRIEPLKAAETIRVKCDVHPWMSAYIVGLENPYFGVSGEDGQFSIANLPPGEYTLTAWHEQLGTQEIPVKVEAGTSAELKISFDSP